MEILKINDDDNALYMDIQVQKVAFLTFSGVLYKGRLHRGGGRSNQCRWGRGVRGHVGVRKNN